MNILISLFFSFFYLTPFSQPEVVSKETIASNFYALYSPATVEGSSKIWLGGWRQPNENNWNDEIFLLNRQTGTVKKVLSIQDVAINDPSIVRLTNVHLLMYFTWAFDGIGIAESWDNGKNWSVIGKVVSSTKNGIDDCVGSSPGSVIVGNYFYKEIWIYWHGNYPCFSDYRQRLAADGITPIAPTELLDSPWVANIDVAQQPNGRFLMVADFPLRLLFSYDGLHWNFYPTLTDGILIDNVDAPDRPLSGEWHVSPHFADVTNYGFTLYFSKTPCICWDAINAYAWSLEKWEFTLRPIWMY